MHKNNWVLESKEVHRGHFSIRKTISETKIVIHGQIRNLEQEIKARQAQDKSGKGDELSFLGKHVDKDDIMKRLADNLDQEHFLKMFSIFTVCISKKGEDQAVGFECKSLESDIIIEYAYTLPAAQIDDYKEVLRTSAQYRGVETMMLDENYRIGLHEYLKAHTISENVATLMEHMSVILRQKCVEQIYVKVKEFSLGALKNA